MSACPTNGISSKHLNNTRVLACRGREGNARTLTQLEQACLAPARAEHTHPKRRGARLHQRILLKERPRPEAQLRQATGTSKLQKSWLAQNSWKSQAGARGHNKP